ncbi:hypothetical protein [Sphaerochaeta halotolerans]|uniref:Uncharacterized protein n=1 Tax=Sphaerochaeta halotolerans TaxID=2293840 RepID=A0A372MJC4_9SPIR|nr:hypothetical protein [Sphaerochaeta halotolerans]MBG0767248.1 hypothetical protein [Spirochaetaceae bacterium]MXI85315.1 hypothetical protein [Sphaerochaeta halotolerans]RFU95844.1 hypothetical protein DYP60_02235 [Sphaerochaeta halotolerans]
MVRHATYIKPNGIQYRVTNMFHGICGFFSLFLIWGLVLNLSEGVSLFSMIHILILLLLTLAGTFYRDTWIFNKQDQIITSIYGFGPLCRREQFTFSEVHQLELTHFVRGTTDKDAKPTKRRFRAMIVFSLSLGENDTRDIEIIAEKTSAGRTESAVQAISAVTGLPLYVDRPRDLDLHVSYKDMKW